MRSLRLLPRRQGSCGGQGRWYAAALLLFISAPLAAEAEIFEGHSLLNFGNRSNNLCWSGGVVASERRWRGPPGRNLTIAMCSSYWTAQELSSRILMILIQERLGVHLDVDFFVLDNVLQYIGIAGCRDVYDWSCEVFDPTNPPYHFSPEYWPDTRETCDSMLAHIQDPSVHQRVINTGAIGYMATDTVYIWQHTVDDVLQRSNGTVSLDWYRSLQADDIMQYFTPISQFNTAWGVYQWGCDGSFSDYDQIASWGYVCNPDFEYDNPWRKPFSNGTWNPNGDYPTSIRPLYNCSEILAYYPGAVTQYTRHGYECRDEGWWLTPPCIARSPGREYRDNCIPVLTYDPTRSIANPGGIGIIAAAVGPVSYWDTLEEYVYDWAEGHATRGGPPNVALFEWWEPDASIQLNYGSYSVLPMEKTALMWTPADGPPVEAVQTLAHEDVFNFAPEVAALLQKYKLKKDDIDGMMAATAALQNSGLDLARAKDEAACQWINANVATWQTWVGAGSCWANTYFEESVGRCLPCPTGYTSERGSSGIGSCRPCPSGQVFQSGLGCVNCETGEYASNTTGRCEWCPKGTYQNSTGAASCRTCPAGFTTHGLGSVEPASCVCEAGLYLPFHREFCAPCPEGQSCPEGSDEAVYDLLPRLLPGFWSPRNDPMSVYRCYTKSHCPGGPPQSCAPHREASEIACGICDEESYQDGDGTCYKCEEDNYAWLFFLVVFLGGLGGLTVLAFVVNRDLLLQQNASLTCVTLAGLTFTALQTLGVYGGLSVTFFEPLTTLLRAMTLLSFDPKVLKADCIFTNNVVVNFLGRQLIAPAAAVIVGVAIIVKVFLKPGTMFFVEFVNTVGTVFTVFFISIMVSAVTPFICYQHPGNSGSSMIKAPSVLCFATAEHSELIGIGIAGFVVVLVPFIAFVICGTLNYPRMVASGEATGAKALQSLRFLFFRFHPKAYYYGSLLLLRNMSLCLVPVVIRDDGAAQVIVMAAILLAGMVVQLRLQPWRSNVTNLFDGVLVGILLLLLLCGAMSTDMRVHERSLRWMGTLSFTAMLVMVLGTFIYGIYLRLIPWPYYQHFVCHHKAGAAAQARLLKIMLIGRTNRSVFIDSDDLEALDALFDIVRCKVNRLIILLTRETLSRPWCSGEIVTAHRNNVKAMAIKATDFQPPTEEQMADIASYLDGRGEVLAKYLITPGDVTAAYKWLLGDEMVTATMRTDVRGRNRFNMLVGEILGNSNNVASTGSLGSGSPTAFSDMLLVSSDGEDDEAVASAAIFASNVQQDFLGTAGGGVVMLADYLPISGPDMRTCVQKAVGMVVVLSRKSMESSQQLEAIVEAMPESDDPGRFIIPVITPNFSFPSPSYYTEVLPKLWTGSASVDEAERLIREFFRIIGVSFNTSASEEILLAQSKQVLSRVTLGKRQPSSSRIQKTNSSAGNSSAGLAAQKTSVTPTASGTQNKPDPSAACIASHVVEEQNLEPLLIL